jgi:hypothetical protein
LHQISLQYNLSGELLEIAIFMLSFLHYLNRQIRSVFS